MSETAADRLVLRVPAHRVSPRAVPFWRATAAIASVVEIVIAVVVYVVVPQRPWWATVLLALVVVTSIGYVAVMPTLRYRIHRWEVGADAIHTRAGWLTISSRIAPINRVQTVDSRQGAFMRLFGLASLTVTTASAAGPIRIDCLDAETVRELVAQLTVTTAASSGDAT